MPQKPGTKFLLPLGLFHIKHVLMQAEAFTMKEIDKSNKASEDSSKPFTLMQAEESVLKEADDLRDKKRRKSDKGRMAQIQAAKTLSYSQPSSTPSPSVPVDPSLNDCSDEENHLERELKWLKQRGDKFKHIKDAATKQAKYWKEKACDHKEELESLGKDLKVKEKEWNMKEKNLEMQKEWLQD
ncbi:hypothetical protein BT96DRAFT_939145 [Gymnopus androsaceus JB14]|uniref:No apical meristem-associated C-terminal domain-containing protein n=1 Tax=Gymnopus androsaceus JB14 TaxID=1447944 RepID=A0A6A4HSX8_9AGAR|nr:hypothetical protein BT96DRAFT_939145 [Gymnopus androsaceus JB14]